jgi:hypothetical protein
MKQFLALLLTSCLLLFLSACSPLDDTFDFAGCPSNCWAFQERFNGSPLSPSQTLLPRSLDYVVTHRSHPADHLSTWGPYPADHGEHCEPPVLQHAVHTHHSTNGSSPDQSFYICNNHLMSSMGELGAVDLSGGYSVSSFWPKQEFDFSQGGTLEFDVNINGPHPRSWFEILISPREQMRVAAAHEYFPIDETYPKSRIVLDFMDNRRYIQVGTGALDPAGIIAESSEALNWQDRHPSDPANQDRSIRRKMRIRLTTDHIHWSIRQADGRFDTFSLRVPGGLPFSRGLVIFKTHAYTPAKDGNTHDYTFHWDNVRFSGPVVGQYETFESSEVVYLQTGGDKPVGSQQQLTIAIPKAMTHPVLFGQLHNPMRGQVLLSINGRANIVVHPYDYTEANCYSSGWKSFRLELNPAWLNQGQNNFKWTIGPRPACAPPGYPWNGFSVKDLEIQADR